jgi:hypothetical protein
MHMDDEAPKDLKEQAVDRAAEPSSWAAACAILVGAKEHVIGLLTQYLGMSDAAAGNAWGLFVAICGALGVALAESKRRERRSARAAHTSAPSSAPIAEAVVAPAAAAPREDLELAVRLVAALRREVAKPAVPPAARPAAAGDAP